MARLNKNLSGTQITDEVIKRTSSTSLGLGHDTIMATGFEIRTGAGGTGTKLTLTTDYTLGSEDSALSTEAGDTIYTKVAIVNGAYHSIDLYVSYKTVGDYAKSEYAIQEFGEDAIGKWAKLSNGEKIYAGAGIIESGEDASGNWYRIYGDGWAECGGEYAEVITDLTWSTQNFNIGTYGWSMYQAISNAITFPVELSSVESVCGTAGPNCRIVQEDALSNTHINFAIYGYTSSFPAYLRMRWEIKGWLA